MKSLIQKIKNVEREKRVTEALVANKRYDSFYENSKKTRASLVESIEKNSIVPGENMHVNYVRGCPAYSESNELRGKIVDIYYGENGKVVLKTGLFRNKSIPFEQIEEVEYKPEIREAKEEKSRRGREEYNKEVKDKGERAKEAMRLTSHYNLNLEFPENKIAVGAGDLGRLMYNSCEGESFDCKSRHCRGPQTGLGEGDFTTWSIEKDDELIAVSGSYGYSGSSGFTHRRGVELHSPLLNGTKCVNSHTAGEIENPDLRKFVYNFYEAWKK